MPERLQDWVTLQAARRPDAVAVAGESDRLSYAGLDGLSSRLARALRTRGCRKGDRVCVLMPRSPTAIACLLGIYKADGIYVPLDPACPARRLRTILASCEARWILAGGPVEGLLDEVLAGTARRRSIAVGWMDVRPPAGTSFEVRLDRSDVEACSPAPVPSRSARQDTAHILFTSGSSGTPKGVAITHGNVIRFVEWARDYFRLGPLDRLSGHPPLHFDLSFLDIFGSFAAGACLHLVPPEVSLLPHRLAEFIRGAKLTQWFSVPSVLNYMAKFDVVKPGDFPDLKRLLWCGEVFPTPSLIYWMRRLPHVRFTNLYGPTETTIASSYYTVPRCPEDDKAAIPIGTACDGEELLVLDAALAPVPPGTVGDLYIRGAGLSPGYWNDPEKTREAFLPDPRGGDPSDRIYRTGDLAKVGEDGQVYLLGRADSQIKSRGYRIELGEVEAGLSATGLLRESAVVAVPTDGFEGAVICCAYVPANGAGVTPASLRRALARHVPPYMLPVRWRALDRLPLNGSGKIDRRALKETFERHEA
jgi:amino acid adenylation domain-containing protein